jgi:hypothetical protein
MPPIFDIKVSFNGFIAVNGIQAPTKDKAVQFVSDMISCRLNSINQTGDDFDYQDESVEIDNLEIETEELDDEE